MDVTEYRFDSALRLLRESLPDARFVAMDLEFTGLGEAKTSFLDTPDRRYQIARDDAERFPPCQVGVVIFRQAPVLPDDADFRDRSATWEALPFNFNVCPRALYANPGARYPMMDRVFSIQAASAQFLAQNGFSFDKMFLEGIGWLRPDEEDIIRAQARRAAHINPVHGTARSKLSLEDERKLTHVDQRIREWLDLKVSFNASATDQSSNQAASKTTKNDVLSACSTVDPTEDRSPKNMMADFKQLPEAALFLDQPNHPILRRAIRELIAVNYPNISVATEHDLNGGPSQLRLTLMASTAEASAATAEARRCEILKISESRLLYDVGFRHVVDALISARVPVVLHNGLSDVCKIYANFIAPLPQTLVEFKANVKKKLPTIVDTKVMLSGASALYPWLAEILESSAYMGRTALEGLADAIDRESACIALPLPKVRIFCVTESFRNGESIKDCVDEISSVVDDTNNESDASISIEMRRYAGLCRESYRHEAGYDALVTGRLFLQLVSLLSGQEVRADDNLGRTGDISLLAMKPVSSMINRLYLPSCGGYKHIDLAYAELHKDDDNIYEGRDDVYVLRGFLTEMLPNGEPFVPRETMLAQARVVAQADGIVLDEKQCSSVRNGIILMVPIMNHAMSVNACETHQEDSNYESKFCESGSVSTLKRRRLSTRKQGPWPSQLAVEAASSLGLTLETYTSSIEWNRT